MQKNSVLIDKVKRALLAMQRQHWEQGMAAQAFLELGEMDMVILMAKDTIVRQIADGRVAMLYTEIDTLNSAASGEPLLVAIRETGDPVLQKGYDRMLDYYLRRAPRSAEGYLYVAINTQEFWVDHLCILPPFYAVAGYPREAIEQIDGYHKYLWNPTKKLYSQIWDDNFRTFKRADFWGVGNGWAASGFAKVIRALPREMIEEKNKLANYARDVIDGCLAYQRSDGLFHDVLDNPKTFVETNLSQMLAYAIYRGLQDNWLPAGYRAIADKMRAAAHGKVDQWGLVQDVCGAPNFNAPGVAAEGQAFFLLMEAAVADLDKSTK